MVMRVVCIVSARFEQAAQRASAAAACAAEAARRRASFLVPWRRKRHAWTSFRDPARTRLLSRIRLEHASFRGFSTPAPRAARWLRRRGSSSARAGSARAYVPPAARRAFWVAAAWGTRPRPEHVRRRNDADPSQCDPSQSRSLQSRRGGKEGGGAGSSKRLLPSRAGGGPIVRLCEVGCCGRTSRGP